MTPQPAFIFSSDPSVRGTLPPKFAGQSLVGYKPNVSLSNGELSRSNSILLLILITLTPPACLACLINTTRADLTVADRRVIASKGALIGHPFDLCFAITCRCRPPGASYVTSGGRHKPIPFIGLERW